LPRSETSPAASISPEVALERLKAGNVRFVATPVSLGHPSAELRATTAHDQHPFAIILGCADSRSPPELLFDQSIGDLFVIRTAGNLVDNYVLGGIEYAIGQLGVRLVVVLGHERCGAVKAALASASGPGHVNDLVRDIQPAVEIAKRMPGEVLVNTVRVNARLMAEKIRKETILGDIESQIQIVTGYYDLDTGVVDWTDHDSIAK
jgi:carbonic anhydrase